MAQGAMIPLVIAILTQLCKYFAQSFAYKFSFQAVGETMKPKYTLPLVFGTFFLNTVFPSLNLAGTTLVVDDARRRGIAPGKATSAAILMQITVDSAFATIMVISFTILALTVGLSPLWLLLGLLVILLVSVLIGIMVLGNKNPALIIRILTPIANFINKVLVRFNKKPLEPWVDKTIMSFSGAAKLIAKNPKSTAKAFGCSIVASCCELSAFCLVGFSFGVSVPESLVCGYVVATLFAMISITPQGVGVVEAAVTVAFTAFGASATAGMAIGLVYRGIVFWMPFIIGAILIQTTKTFRPDSKKKKVEKAPKGNFNYEREQAEITKKAQAQREKMNAIRPHLSSSKTDISATDESSAPNNSASDNSASDSPSNSASDSDTSKSGSNGSPVKDGSAGSSTKSDSNTSPAKEIENV